MRIRRAALVTGASRGIGRAIALTLARKMPVVVNYRSDEASAQAVAGAIREAGGEALLVQADVAVYADVQRMSDEIRAGGLWVHTLVNNAGITQDQIVALMPVARWQQVIDCNLNGPFYCAKEFSQTMISRRTGVIVNMSSISGLHGQPGQANYSASKAGLVGLTKTLAKELGCYGVRVNCVAPGFVDTDMVAALRVDAKVQARVDMAIQELTPLRRMGTPQEIADVVAFLVSDAAAYMTGQTLEVDGGLAM